MDIKELIKIVIEIIDKIKMEESQNKIGIFFAKENQKILKAKINSEKIFYYKDYKEDILPDILYLDFISIKILPIVALGMDDDGIGSLIKKMLLNNKKIIVLGFDYIDKNKVSLAYYNLFQNYYNIAKSYGIEFEEEKNISSDEFVFTEKVLTRKNIMNNKNHKKIIVEKNTVITALALEEAVKENITILKR